MPKRIRIIGGGLAGPEAALQAAALGCTIDLYEMRPHRSTEAHQTADFAELVCSNSLKSESEHSAPWLLKQEMRLAQSFLLADADATAVPAGHALAVDRVLFSERVRQRLEHHSNITIHREEVTHLDEHALDTITILATGPLTSPALAAELARLTGRDHLAFYDSISPIVDASTIDMDRVYFAARWNRGTADYINCPFTREEYDTFLEALTTAETIPAKAWEALPTDHNPTHLATDPNHHDTLSLLSSRSAAEGSASLPRPFHSCVISTGAKRSGETCVSTARAQPATRSGCPLHDSLTVMGGFSRRSRRPPTQTTSPAKAPVLRRLPPHRRNRPPRPRHPPLRPHEARRP